MSKVSAKTAETAGKAASSKAEAMDFQAEAMNFSPEVLNGDAFRMMAEQGVARSKEAYAKMKAGAEEAQKALETTVETARAASVGLSLKALSAYRAGVDADLSHMEALAGVKSFSDLIELQTSYLRRRTELALTQGKDIQAAATKAVQDVASPVKAAWDKTLVGARFA